MSVPSHFSAVSQMLRIPNANHSSKPPDVRFALQKLLVIGDGAPRYTDQTMATIGSKARQFWHHPAGPKTIHVSDNVAGSTGPYYLNWSSMSSD